MMVQFIWGQPMMWQLHRQGYLTCQVLKFATPNHKVEEIPYFILRYLHMGFELKYIKGSLKHGRALNQKGWEKNNCEVKIFLEYSVNNLFL